MEKNFTLFPINEIQENPDNPRFIRDKKFEDLKKSIHDFPEMMELRPVVIDENNMILGGNMRFRACKELGWDEIPCYQIDDLTPEQKEEFIMKDNINQGEWDWDRLLNDFDNDHLKNWGFDEELLAGIVEEPEIDNSHKDKLEKETVRCTIGSYQIEVPKEDYQQWKSDLKSVTDDPETEIRQMLGL